MVAWWKSFYSPSRESEEQQNYSTSSYEEEELHRVREDGSTTVDLYSLLGVGVMVRVAAFAMYACMHAYHQSTF